ncbi:DNA-binding response regulator, NarL/FixJ family, contains REC and HTH domains [Spirosomataceae bacterium TFI 002]|nr:DNA-binding response regulator, NarL/FixJ family, contains REC and HTH domains [Spirosomataceae bacterium TFI 002]
MKNKILIADDHKLFGEGLKELLRKQGDYMPFGPEKEKYAIEEAISEINPKVLLLDINLGKLDGLELGKDLKVAFPYLKIIMLTMYENEKMLKLSKLYGMDGYLLKDCETKVLLNGIKTVIDGGSYFVEFEAEPKYEMSTALDSFLAQYQLSDREVEIIDHLVKGLNNQEIAEILNLSYHTVKTHRKNIYLKLDVSNVPELITKMNSN